MHPPGVSRHLKVLRDAGLVEVRQDAQRRLYRLRPEPLMELDAWLEPFRAECTARLDSLEKHLRRTPEPIRPSPKEHQCAPSRLPPTMARWDAPPTPASPDSNATSPTRSAASSTHS